MSFKVSIKALFKSFVFGFAVDEKENLYGNRPNEQDEEGLGPIARP